MKTQIEIRVGKGNNGAEVAGPFFIKSLNFDELNDYMERVGKSTDETENKLRLVAMTLCKEDDTLVFSPQTFPNMANRISGVDLMAALMSALKANPIDKLSKLGEEYEEK